MVPHRWSCRCASNVGLVKTLWLWSCSFGDAGKEPKYVPRRIDVEDFSSRWPRSPVLATVVVVARNGTCEANRMVPRRFGTFVPRSSSWTTLDAGRSCSWPWSFLLLFTFNAVHSCSTVALWSNNLLISLRAFSPLFFVRAMSRLNRFLCCRAFSAVSSLKLHRLKNNNHSSKTMSSEPSESTHSNNAWICWWFSPKSNRSKLELNSFLLRIPDWSLSMAWKSCFGVVTFCP